MTHGYRIKEAEGAFHFGAAGAANAMGAVAGTITSETIEGAPVGLDPSQLQSIAISSVFAGAAGAGLRPLVGATLSPDGRPATRISTLMESIVRPGARSRAAFQVYGKPVMGIYAAGLGFAGGTWSAAKDKWFGAVW